MSASSPRRGNLVGVVANQLRDMIFAAEPDTLIGSLQDLAKAFGVGIVTVQQAARVLEHEGLLEVRRGPGGGYYGRRPDAAAVERSIAAYLRSNATSFEDALNVTSLLFNELTAAAADCADRSLHDELARLSQRLADCHVSEDIGTFESDFQDLLFRMVDRPLFKLLTFVTLRVASTRPHQALGMEGDAILGWRAGRERIIAAILDADAELARFEADRHNRRSVLKRIASLH